MTKPIKSKLKPSRTQVRLNPVKSLMETKPLQVSVYFCSCYNLLKLTQIKNVGRLRPVLLFERASSADVFLWILQTFYEYFFFRTFPGNCFWYKKKRVSFVCFKVAQLYYGESDQKNFEGLSFWGESEAV